ncbi:MAG: hypothetical protein KDD43_13865, partial [Bdellovibrionales bacterium]|nr:hypothetical protein [Bdellovibrionales bacterium]
LAQDWIECFPRAMVVLKPVRKNFGEEFYEYTDDEWEIFRDRSGFFQPGFNLSPEVVETRKWLVDENHRTYRVREIVAHGYHQFKDWKCWAGLDNLHVTTEGEIWRATCREGGSLGNLATGWMLPDEPILCTKQSCVCQRDLYSQKAKAGVGLQRDKIPD